MEKGRIGKRSADEWSTEHGQSAGHPWAKITDESWKLSHIVQAGRRVSKEQLLEVDREVSSPRGFVKK